MLVVRGFFVLAKEVSFSADIGRSLKKLLRFTNFEGGYPVKRIHPNRTGEGQSLAYNVRL